MSYCKDEIIARMAARDAANCTKRRWRFYKNEQGIYIVELDYSTKRPENAIVCHPTREMQGVRPVFRTRVVRSRVAEGTWEVFAYDEHNQRLPTADYHTECEDDAHRVALSMVTSGEGLYCVDCLTHVPHFYRVEIGTGKRKGEKVGSGFCLKCADRISHQGKGRTVKHDH